MVGEWKDPIRQFFEQYPDIIYEPSIRPARQFDQLVQQKNWDFESEEFQIALSQLQTAMLQQFDPSIVGSCPIVKSTPESKSAIEDFSNPDLDTKRGNKSAKRNMKEFNSAAMANAVRQKREGADPSSNTLSVSCQENELRAGKGINVEGTSSRLSGLFIPPGAAKSVPSSVHWTTNSTTPVRNIGAVPGSGHGAEPDQNQTSRTEIPNSRKVRTQRKNKRKKNAKRKEASSPMLNPHGRDAETGSGTTTQVQIPDKVLMKGECSSTPNAPLPQVPPSIIISDPESSTPVFDHLDAFFERYPGFYPIRDRTESVATQLGRLRRQQQWWGSRMNLWDICLGHYQEALVLQFNAWYGTDVGDLRTWHRVLRVIGVEPPGSVSECKRLIDSIHVNIVDLVDASLRPGSRPVTIFRSEDELSEYTISWRKFFPKKHAYAGGVLRYLLREIF